MEYQQQPFFFVLLVLSVVNISVSLFAELMIFLIFLASETKTSLKLIPILAEVSKKLRLCLLAKAYPWSFEIYLNSSRSDLFPTKTIETVLVSILSLIDLD